MNRFFAAFAMVAILFAAAPLRAAGVAGLWTGVIAVSRSGGAPVRTSVQVRLEREGADLTGEIGRQGENEQVSIRNGRVEGSEVYFEASNSETKSPMKFRLTLSGNRLEGEMSGEAQQGKITGQVRLTRGAQ